MTIKRSFLLSVALALAACSVQSGSLPSSGGGGAKNAKRSPIEHVVFIIQENRSFNNLFMGFPGATTAASGRDTGGRKIRLRAERLNTLWDIDHSAKAFFAACDGRGTLRGTQCTMDGWNNEIAWQGAPPNAPYAYVPRDEVEPYWQIAKEYVLADRAFASNLDGSFTAHQYAVAAYADRVVDYPSAVAWGCEGGPTDTIPTLRSNRTYGRPIPVCFDIPTLAGEADAAGVSWRFYAGYINGDGGLWSSYQADRSIYHGPDWNRDVVSPPSQFLTDVANGDLPAVTWIAPTFENSDHAGFFSSTNGPKWVASIVDAIGESPFWKSTAIFILWDDWGGWFDPVKPIYEDYDGLGFRVPLLMVSPYAKRGYVTHVQYETASVLRFIEDNFGLATLAASDARANDPAYDAFDFTQKPRPFKKIAGTRPTAFWTSRERASKRHGIPKTTLGD